MVAAALRYLKPNAARAVIYGGKLPRGQPEFSGEHDVHHVGVIDARTLPARLTLEDAGVELLDIDTGLHDEEIGGAGKARYLEAIADLIKRRTQAFFVHSFSGIVRNAVNAGKPGSENNAPVHFVHNDYSAISALRSVRALLPDRADELLQRPFAVINAWKPLYAAVEQHPLAVCDARTIEPTDLVPVTFEFAGRTGEMLSANHREEHRWYYYSAMNPAELLLMKLFESRAGESLWTLHTAFDDPTAPANPRPRLSIEVRNFVFF